MVARTSGWSPNSKKFLLHRGHRDARHCDARPSGRLMDGKTRLIAVLLDRFLVNRSTDLHPNNGGSAGSTVPVRRFQVG